MLPTFPKQRRGSIVAAYFFTSDEAFRLSKVGWVIRHYNRQPLKQLIFLKAALPLPCSNFTHFTTVSFLHAAPPNTASALERSKKPAFSQGPTQQKRDICMITQIHNAAPIATSVANRT